MNRCKYPVGLYVVLPWPKIQPLFWPDFSVAIEIACKFWLRRSAIQSVSHTSSSIQLVAYNRVHSHHHLISTSALLPQAHTLSTWNYIGSGNVAVGTVLINLECRSKCSKIIRA